MPKELTKKVFLDEVERDLNGMFNELVSTVVTELVSDSREGGYSPVLTGFFASSWKASTQPLPLDDPIRNFPRWANIKTVNTGSRTVLAPGYKPIIDRRYPIPKVTIKDTVYISNPATYSAYTYASPKSKVLHYIQGGPLDGAINRVFKDKRDTISVASNAPTKYS